MKAKVTLTALIFKRWVYRCVCIPKKAFGVTPPVVPLPVVVRLGDDAFESTLTSQDKENYILIVPMAHLKVLDLEVGDSLRLTLEPDLGRKAPDLPEVMVRFFRDHPARLALFRKETIASQRQFVKYVTGVQNPVGQLTRLERLADRLQELAEARQKRAKAKGK